MNNEELALRIQASEKDLIAQLWEQMARLVYRYCNVCFSRYEERCARAGVTLDDITQEGYFALLDAVQGYDPAKGYKLTAYIKYPIMKRIRAILGIARRRVLDDAGSLNEEIAEDLTIEDMLEDETAQQAMSDALDRVWAVQLHADLEKCLESLDPDGAAAIRARYYDGAPIPGARAIERRALDALKRRRHMLRAYKKDIISRYGYNSSYTLWRESGSSSTEYATLKILKREGLG